MTSRLAVVGATPRRGSCTAAMSGVAIPGRSLMSVNASSSCDLDLDPMIMILDFDLDILRRTGKPEMKFIDEGFQKLDQEQNRHTDTHATGRITTPHSRIVKIKVTELFWAAVYFTVHSM